MRDRARMRDARRHSSARTLSQPLTSAHFVRLNRVILPCHLPRIRSARMFTARRILLFLPLFAVVTLAAAQPAAKKSAPAKKPDPGIALHTLFDSEWQYGLQQNPLFASFQGDRRWNDKLPDVSLAAVEKDFAHTQETLKKLAAIDRSALTPADQLNYDLFKRAEEPGL